MIDCIVLAGGLGTRLRSVVADRPKPLALIDGVPFLSLLMHTLAASRQVRKTVLAVGYQAEAIVKFFSYRPFAMPVEFSGEELPLGTGGAVKKALEMTESEYVLVLNGDSYVEFSLANLLEQHQNDSVQATLVYTHLEDASRFGRLEIDNKRVLAFQEKTDAKAPGFINAGVYLFNRTIFDSFSLPEQFSLERDLFPLITPMGAFRAGGRFIDIGTPDSYREAQTFLQPLVHNL